MPSEGPRSASQVPGEETFTGDDPILPIGRQHREKCLRAGFHLAMDHNLAVLGEDAPVHGARVQVAAAGPWVRPGVASPEVSSSFASLPSASIPRRDAEEGASRSITRMQATASSLVSLLSGVGEFPSWLPGCDRPSSLRSTETGAELGSSPPYPCRARTVVRCQGARIIQGRASQELRDVVAPGVCWY
jgi:hypothetical protein